VTHCGSGLQVFSAHYCSSNPEVVQQFVKGADTVLLLAFATVLLNTDLHNSCIRPEHKMTILQFIHNLRGLMLHVNCHCISAHKNNVRIKLKIKWYSSPEQVISELCGVTCHVESHSVTCLPTQVNSPWTGWYSIYLPKRDGRLTRNVLLLFPFVSDKNNERIYWLLLLRLTQPPVPAG